MSGTSSMDPGFDEELRAALVAFADGPVAPVVDTGAIERAVGRSRVRRGVLGGASVAGAAVLAVAGFLALRPGAEPSLPPAAAASAANGVCTPEPTSGAPETGGSADATPGTGATAGVAPGVVVPDLRGLTLDQAGQLLRGLGLRCTVVWHTDWKVPAGQVIGGAPQGGPGPVAPDSTVLLFASRGKPGGQ
ncbi:PASTA domain-containing protein [Kitasatospora cineracea]|uniref:PASTA domain-containing protein n=1 Tax=Kitasatospora cineracea TaxID=88074 RepID=UPI0037AD91F9